MENKREIKFRYWNEVSGIMVNDPKMPYKKGWTVEQLFSDRGWVWMQFTGLKDKKRKEIYEGDILANREVHGDNFYCVVEYGIDGFNGVTYPGRNHCMPLHTIMTYEGAEYNEVIGNIYENPELLSKLNKE